jgi:hypothetical protein
MELVTLKTFESAIDAHILRSRLSNEGITAFVFDENIMTLNPLYNIMVGGIKLKVSQADVEKATNILQSIEGGPLLDGDDRIVACPACQSTNLYSGFKSMKGITGLMSAILALFLGTYPLYYKTVFRCKDCGTEFQTNEHAKTNASS